MAHFTRNRIQTLAAAVASGSLLVVSPASAGDQPQELGQVSWLRDFDQAVETSRSSGKPILILFDEVPGCATCVNYGEAALSHPLIVEAAEDLFVPVAVYNNVEGKDRVVLSSFREPTWNNPVVRIVDADRNELTPRHAGDYSVAGLAGAMVAALDAQSAGAAPEYLRLLATERDDQLKRATFAMHCFWVGEAKLGALDGVVSTRTGWLDNSEVVELQFDPRVITFEALTKEAQSLECADRIFARSAAQERAAKRMSGSKVKRTDQPMRPTPKDDKYELAQTPWRFIPMTESQATKANARIEQGKDPSVVLSPGQCAMFEQVTFNSTRERAGMIGRTDLEAAFEAFRAEESRSGS